MVREWLAGGCGVGRRHLHGKGGSAAEPSGGGRVIIPATVFSRHDRAIVPSFPPAQIGGGLCAVGAGAVAGPVAGEEKAKNGQDSALDAAVAQVNSPVETAKAENVTITNESGTTEIASKADIASIAQQALEYFRL